MDIKTIRMHKKNYSILGGILSNNPILIQGLALAPAVIASTSLKNALALCLCAAIVFLPTLFVVSFIKDKNQVPEFMRIFFYALISSLFFIPASYLTKMVFPSAVDMLGIYMPLLVVNTIIIVRADVIAVRSRPFVALLDAFFHLAGFTVAVLFAAAVREYFASGTLYGIIVNERSQKLSGVSLPFIGFILFGLLSAFCQLLKQKIHPAYNKWVKKRITIKASSEFENENFTCNDQEG